MGLYRIFKLDIDKYKVATNKSGGWKRRLLNLTKPTSTGSEKILDSIRGCFCASLSSRSMDLSKSKEWVQAFP